MEVRRGRLIQHQVDELAERDGLAQLVALVVHDLHQVEQHRHLGPDADEDGGVVGQLERLYVVAGVSVVVGTCELEYVGGVVLGGFSGHG